MSSAEVAAPRSEPVLTIKPPTRWGKLGAGELWDSRELVYFLAKREVQIRYKQSMLGISWAVLQPIGMAFVFALFFGVLIDVDSGGIPYPVFALVGLVPWTFASQTILQGSQSLVLDSPLLSKVYFPRLAIPIAKGLGLTLDLAIAFVVMIVVVLAYGVELTPTALLAPLFLLLTALTAFSLATFFAAVYVQYRDMLVVVPIFIQIMLFLSPLIYPSSLVVGNWRYVYFLNPFATAIDGMRWCLADGPALVPSETAISVAAALAMFVVAIVYFRRSEQHFADVV